MRGRRNVGTGGWSGSAWRAAAELLGALVLAGALLAAPFAYLGVRAARQPVHHQSRAIRVGARSCPAVQSIESATQAFEYAWYDAVAADAPWTTPRARLERTLARLDDVLARNLSSLPVPVATQLRVVRANVRRGVLVVRGSTSFGDVDNRGYRQLNAASAAYGQATTLVGDACGSLYVVRGPRPSPESAREFAGLADWVCGAHQERCPTTTTAPRPNSG